MNRAFYLLFWLVFSLNLNCQQAQNFDEMVKDICDESIPFIQAHDVLKSKKVLIFDTREKAEYNVSHLPNAIWAGYKSFSLDDLPDWSKTDTVIVYCSVGYRSEKKGETLKRSGYKNVFNLYGGIFKWANLELPLTNNSNEAVYEVHGYNRSWSKWLDKEKVNIVLE